MEFSLTLDKLKSLH